MKNKICILTVALLLSLTSCNKNEEAKENNKFGDFSYNGIFLNEYAKKAITLEEAKNLIYIEPFNEIKNVNKAISLFTTEENSTVNDILQKYGNLVVTVKYYVDQCEEQQVRKDFYQGTDFKNLLFENHYSPFSQINIKYLFVDSNLLDFMENENVYFQEASKNLISPFSNPYTYHSTENNRLDIQIHSFAELPASLNGGIGSTFREDCELVFDEEGKINIWQTSLGLYTSTPNGTIKQGYIFQANFEWLIK